MIPGALFTFFVVPSIYVLVAHGNGGGPCGSRRPSPAVPELAEALV